MMVIYKIGKNSKVHLFLYSRTVEVICLPYSYIKNNLKMTYKELHFHITGSCEVNKLAKKYLEMKTR